MFCKKYYVAGAGCVGCVLDADLSWTSESTADWRQCLVAGCLSDDWNADLLKNVRQNVACS